MLRIFYLLLILALPSMTYGLQTLKVASGEWPPMTGQALPHGGFCTHLAKEIFPANKYRLVIDYYPWKRSLQYIAEGTYDIGICWVANEKRHQLYRFSDSVMLMSRKVFFHRVDQPFEWKNFDDIKSYTLGLTRGYSYGDRFDRFIQNLVPEKAQKANSDLQNLNKLLRGRIDLFPLDTMVGYYLIYKHLGQVQNRLLTNHPQPLDVSEHYLIVSKKIDKARAQQILADFETGLAHLKASGRYEELLDLSLNGYYK